MLILTFIDSLQNPLIKSKIRLRNSKTLSDIFQHALEEDTRQKVRAVDFGEATSSNITQWDINAIRDNKCYKCGKDGNFIKDCPLNQDHSQYHHSQNHYKGGYSPLNTNESNSENTLATLAKTVNDLSLLLKEHTQNSFQSQNHTHTTDQHIHTNITDIVVTPRTVIIISQIVAIGIDHKTINIVHTTDHNIALTIDHTIIHKTDHTIDSNTNTALKSMR